MWDDLKGLFLFFVLIIIGLWAITWGIYKYTVEISEANIIDVYDGTEKIYQGKQAFVNVESGGMTTHLTIYRNLYPTIVSKTYSSANIRIIPHKGDGR